MAMEFVVPMGMVLTAFQALMVSLRQAVLLVVLKLQKCVLRRAWMKLLQRYRLIYRHRVLPLLALR